MNVILREDVPHLGEVGDLVTVKAGFARNYLCPAAWLSKQMSGNAAALSTKSASLRSALLRNVGAEAEKRLML